ncbi:MAG: apolipoprotein N-acyltransferase [Omnitrophica bacterium RBG_13_46_9]|nr:MAG: apolipoprotein N-acyltransferase [Omnitrophica bacterium RBG_13_46_9]
MRTGCRLGCKLTLSVISSVLLILTYPKFNLEFLAWIALIPLFFALENHDSRLYQSYAKQVREGAMTGFLFGVAFFSGILYWVANVTVPGTIALILLMSTVPAVFCLLYTMRFQDSLALRQGASARGSEWQAFIFVPSAWVCSEYLRSHFFTGFPWALLGCSQSFNLKVIQIADITGVYGVSFFVAFINFGLYLTLKRISARPCRPREIFSRIVYPFFFLLILSALVLAYGHNRISRIYPAQRIKIAVIQGNIPQNLKWDSQYRDYIIDKYETLTKEAAREKPGLIVWPETSLPGYLEYEANLKDKILGLAKSEKTYLLVGTLREEGAKFFNSAALISDNGEIVSNYSKIHLVPFGEYIPLADILSFIRIFIDKPIGDFEKGGEFTVFNFKLHRVSIEPGSIQKTTEFHKFGVLICFEDIFPYLGRRFVLNGARFLVNITNDAWFGRTASPYQHMQHSVFRAVENRVPVVRAANTGLSCIIDHNGKVIKSVKAGEDETFIDGYAVGTIMPTFANTFYTRFGDIFSWFCIMVTAVSLLAHFKSKYHA